MRVSKVMDLGQLAELMGQEATQREAELMRQFLVDECYDDTDAVDESEWLEMVRDAVEEAEAETRDIGLRAEAWRRAAAAAQTAADKCAAVYAAEYAAGSRLSACAMKAYEERFRRLSDQWDASAAQKAAAAAAAAASAEANDGGPTDADTRGEVVHD